jgi:hypothetical protein
LAPRLFALSMAWLSGSVEYWIQRLTPFFTQGRPALVCIANRTGVEDETGFCGLSCILHFDGQAGVAVLGALDGLNADVLVAESSARPIVSYKITSV